MDKVNDKDQIVPGGPASLVKRNLGLVRRGLEDVEALTVKRRKRILLTTCQEAIDEVFGEIFRSAGYEVRSSTHPSEVVALVEEFRPDVALIGLIMPELDGVKLSQQLSPRFPTVKIVFTGDIIEEGILQSLFDMGIPCDTLDVPCERKDMLEMMADWSLGLDHIDPATRLRDAKHFEWALVQGGALIFVELFQSSSSHGGLDKESTFLSGLGARLGRFARDGFAYRRGENQFAILLPRQVGKQEACETAKKLNVEITSLLQQHGLSDRFLVAVGVVGPEDGQSPQEAREIGRRLIRMVKGTACGGVAAWRVGLIH